MADPELVSTLTVQRDKRTDAEVRALDEVIELLARHEGGTDPEGSAQIRRWVNDTADQFADAPIKNYIPILVEHIVRDRIRRSPPQDRVRGA